MPNLEDITKRCGWRNLVLKRKESDPDYHPLGNPLFVCLTNCEGYNFNCGGYYKGDLKLNEVDFHPS